jgi:AcrR family transcriptional regulator
MIHIPDAHEETRNRICVVAETLFRQWGYGKTTVADIARALGMSSANVYRFFATKSAINDTIARRMLQEQRIAYQAILDRETSAAERVEALILAKYTRNKAQFTTDKSVHDMVVAAMEENWTAIDEHLTLCRQMFVTLLTQGMENGEFTRGDPARLAEVIMRSCACIFHPQLIAKCGDQDQQFFAHDLAHSILRGLRNPDPYPSFSETRL